MFLIWIFRVQIFFLVIIIEFIWQKNCLISCWRNKKSVDRVIKELFLFFGVHAWGGEGMHGSKFMYR